MIRLRQDPALRGMLVLLALWAGMATPPVAVAHAMFEGSTPVPGTNVATSPREIVMTFNEPVTPVAVRLLDAGLRDAGQAAAPKVDGNSVRLRLGAALPDGQYLVTYRVISEDAHPVAASFEFAVGAATEPGALAVPTAEASGDWAAVGRVSRPIALLALMLAAGSALFLALPAAHASLAVRAAAADLGRVATWLALGLAAAGFAIGGAEMLGGGARALVAPAAWRVAAGSTLGTSTLLAILGSIAVLCGLRRRDAAASTWALLVAGAVALAASRGVTGHAAATSRGMMLALAVHATFAAFWAGALWPLWHSLRTDPPAAARSLLDAFSRLAVAAVVALIAAGSYLAWTHVGSLSALIHTGYGQLLTAKLACVAALLGLAGSNKLWLTPALTRPGASARQLRRSIGVEMLVMALVLVVSATLAHTPPPRADQPTSATEPLQGMLMEGDYHVTWQLTPATAGPGAHELTLRVQRHDGTAVEPLGVSASFALPARGIEPLGVPLQRRSAGEYSATVRGLTVPGEWQLGLDILVTDFDKLVLEAPVTLR